MLTEEMLNANEATKGLDKAAKTAIIQLSTDDEKKVIGEHRGEWWRDLDKDIKSVTGEGKPDGIKSHQFLKDTLTSLKGEAEKAANVSTLEGEVTNLKAEKLKLEKQIKEGISDADAKKQIQQLEQQITDKDGEISQLKTNSDTKIKELEKSLETEKSTNMENTLFRMVDEHLIDEKIAWLDTIPEDFLKDTLKGKKEAAVKMMNADKITNSDGSNSLVLRDEDNQIIYDKETSKPLTPGQFFIQNGNLSSIIDTDKSQGGGGGGEGGGGGGGGSATGVIKGAKTQVEAHEMIGSYLMQKKGLSKLDDAYHDEFDKLTDELKVSELPLTANAV